jgi:hypothetical protein
MFVCSHLRRHLELLSMDFPEAFNYNIVKLVRIWWFVHYVDHTALRSELLKRLVFICREQGELWKSDQFKTRVQ